MAEEFPLREFKFKSPLFSEKSPWRQYIGVIDKCCTKAVPALPESDLQGYATFEILRAESVVAAAREFVSASINLCEFQERLARLKRGGQLQVPAINAWIYTYPIFEATPLSAGTTEVLLKKYDGDNGYPSGTLPFTWEGEDCKVSGLPAPESSVRPSDPSDPESDGSLILVDPENLIAFDFWKATVVDEEGHRGQGGAMGTKIVEAGCVARFDIGSTGMGALMPAARRKVTARASALPYLGGLLIPEDLERLNPGAGREPATMAITHALAFILPSMRYLQHRFFWPSLPPDYVYPAASLEANHGTVNPHALAAGQRIRLKDRIVDVHAKRVREEALKPITRIFLNTLRDYGAYLVDGGGAFGFAAEDIHTAPLKLDEEQVDWLVSGKHAACLHAGKTEWECVLDELQNDLRDTGIPFAVPDPGGDNVDMLLLNFEVVENPGVPRQD